MLTCDTEYFISMIILYKILSFSEDFYYLWHIFRDFGHIFYTDGDFLDQIKSKYASKYRGQFMK